MAEPSHRFQVDQRLIQHARSILAEREDIRWIVGGACSGKSTVSAALADALGLQCIDMDQRIYGGFSYDAGRHPAVSTWFSADNPLAWVLSLPWADFDALNRATNAEFLDLLADELGKDVSPTPLLVDGGFTHPSVLAQVVEPSRIVCLAVTPAQSARCWETSEDRAQMRGWVQSLPEPEASWEKFLSFDQRMSEVMVTESRALGVRVVMRAPEMAVADLQEVVCASLGLESPPAT